MKQKTFEIDWLDENGQKTKEKVTIKALGFGEKNELREEFTEVKEMGGMHKVDIHPFRMRVHALRLCILKAPFKWDMESLKTLDDDVGNIVWKEIEEFNKLGPIKKKDSERS